MWSRRDAARLLVGGALGGAGFASAQPASDSVRLGMGTGSLNPRPPPAAGVDPIDDLASQCALAGVKYIEFVGSLLQPAAQRGGGRIPDPLTADYARDRPLLRAWRLDTPIGAFETVRRKFEARGLKIFSYVETFTSDFTDAEAAASFRQAEALGAEVICTNQTKVAVGRHLAPIAKGFKVKLAWHNHARVDDYDEVASLASFRELMAMSPDYRINLDIGHFTAGDNDAVAFVRENHGRISHIHFKDRKRPQRERMSARAFSASS